MMRAERRRWHQALFLSLALHALALAVTHAPQAMAGREGTRPLHVSVALDHAAGSHRASPAPTPASKPIAVAPDPVGDTAAEEEVPSEGLNDAPHSQEAETGAALDAYLIYLRERLQTALRYPPRARQLGITGEAQVYFVVQADGVVPTASAALRRSSGFDLLDRAALETVRVAGPFRPPPRADLQVELMLAFRRP